jgi:hypothetical protein
MMIQCGTYSMGVVGLSERRGLGVAWLFVLGRCV